MEILNVFIYLGIIASAVSGALMGIKKDLDFFGIIILGIATALGGGLIRDVLIGYTPPVALRQPAYTIVSTIVAILVMFFPNRFSNIGNLILFFDALGLGVFTAVGVDIALQLNVSSTFIAITIGVISGVGGGIVRDIFAQEIPLIFRKEIYAVASIAGAFAMVYSRYFIGGMIPLYICFGTTVIIRLLSIYFGIHQAEINSETTSS